VRLAPPLLAPEPFRTDHGALLRLTVRDASARQQVIEGACGLACLGLMARLTARTSIMGLVAWEPAAQRSGP
jgi:hypothetical protein